MKTWIITTLSIVILGLASTGVRAADGLRQKIKVLVVSSYHREYNWSQETNTGLCAAMLQFGYLDNKEQIAEYTKNDYVETSKVVMKKLWMDAKRKNSKPELAMTTTEFIKIAGDFKPDLVLLGDDDAAQYMGPQFLDARVPVVFWGVNNTPVKYGLVDSIEKPGHNVTGVYQSGYYKESLDILHVMVPGAKTFAVLSDDTSTGRSHYKEIEYLAGKGVMPLRFTETVATSDFETWKQKAMELQTKVDAFFVAHYGALKDKNGNHVPPAEVAKWYSTNIKIPEAVEQKQFVQQGMLCGADDSGYRQGFEAVVIAHDILAKGADPATYPPRAPQRGALMVNKKRAELLGITITKEMGIEEYME